MASNTFANRRGQLSRPGVCTPPPPPPPPGLYKYSLKEWVDDPATPTLYLYLTCTDSSIDPIPAAAWTHDTNGMLAGFAIIATYPTVYLCSITITGPTETLYIHSTLDNPPDPVQTASFFFTVPSS